MPGPVPKRSDQRRRTNKRPFDVDRISGAAKVAPDLGVEVHPLVADWFSALSDGPESRYYSPALWQRARLTALLLSRLLESDKVTAQMYLALQNDMKSLLVDAGELRRLGIEVQPAEPVADGSNVIDYRARVSAGA